MKLSTSTQYALQFFSFLVKCLRNMFGLVVVSADLLLLISTFFFFVFAYEWGRGIRTQVPPLGRLGSAIEPQGSWRFVISTI